MSRIWTCDLASAKMFFVRALLCSFLYLVGCSQGVSVLRDTADAGFQDADAALSDAAPSDASDAASRDASADAGAMDAADRVPLTWSQMAMPQNTRSVTCIWGRSRTEIYAGTANGKLLQLGTQGWQQVWSEPSNFGLRDIWGTGDKLFVAAENTLHVHEGGIQQHPWSYRAGSWIHDIAGVSDNLVYIVSDQLNGRGLYTYNGQEVTQTISPTNVAILPSVWASASAVYVGGNGKLFQFEMASLVEQSVSWPAAWSANDIVQFQFTGIGAMGSRLFAVGNRYLIFERDGQGVWQQSWTPLLTDQLHDLAGFEDGDQSEAYAVGASVTGGAIARYYRGTWSLHQFTGNVDLWSVWAAGPDEYFASGNLNNQVEGIILRGSR